MARPKKVSTVVDETTSTGNTVQFTTVEVVPTPIIPLSVDYPSEGLNDIARKINEIISKVNGL